MRKGGRFWSPGGQAAAGRIASRKRQCHGHAQASSKPSVAIIVRDDSFAASCASRVQERFALNHGENQGGEPIVVAGEPGHDLVDRASIGSIEPAAESVGQHLLGEAADKSVAAHEEAVFNSTGP